MKQSIIFVIVIAIAVFITMQVVNGQPEARQQKESLQKVLDYCFQHADRPNPVQDLIDKGFLSQNFTGENCISVRQMHNEVENRIVEYNKNQTALARKICYDTMKGLSPEYEPIPSQIDDCVRALVE